MVKIDISIPDDLDMKIQKLVDDGEFEDYESAVRELISSGITVYRTDNTSSEGLEDDFMDDKMDPRSHDDEYVF